MAVMLPAVVLRRIAQLPLTPTPWKDLAYITLGQLSGIFALTWFLVGPVVSLSLIITLIGIPKLYGDLWVIRWWADGERLRGELAGVPVPRSTRTWRGDGFLARLRSALADPMMWREMVWLILLFGIGTASFVTGLTGFAIGLGFLTLPAWGWSVPDGVQIGILTIHSVGGMVLFAAIAGPPACIAGAWILRGSAWVQAMLGKVLLEGREEERIAELQVSRAGAVDAAAVELRRIERDLHDGAQARLVALAMEIGMAREQIERDPEGAARMLAGAHEDAKTALAELRDLARGIHPAILTDRGLDAAVSALAARCPVPCTVAIDVPGRMPAAIESAAYFTIAEALANVAKHSAASRCEISGRIEDDMLVVKIHDDGAGGLDEARGTGITGLRGRVEALDGKLLIASPKGKGTLLRAELPCGS
jgi:signal transduction histidine kinase